MGDDVTRTLRARLGPAGPELTCAQCFDHLDAYVEHELAGRDADAAVPGMRAHLEGCPAYPRTTTASPRWSAPSASRAAPEATRAGRAAAGLMGTVAHSSEVPAWARWMHEY